MLRRRGAFAVQPLRGDLGESVAPGAMGDPPRLAWTGGSLGVSNLRGSFWKGSSGTSVLRCLCWRGNLGSLEPQFALSVLEKEPGGFLEPPVCAEEGPWTPGFHPTPYWEGPRLPAALGIQVFPSHIWADGPVPAPGARWVPKCGVGVPKTQDLSPCVPQLRLCRDPPPAATSGRYRGLSWSCQRGGNPQKELVGTPHAPSHPACAPHAGGAPVTPPWRPLGTEGPAACGIAACGNRAAGSGHRAAAEGLPPGIPGIQSCWGGRAAPRRCWDSIPLNGRIVPGLAATSRLPSASPAPEGCTVSGGAARGAGIWEHWDPSSR